MKSLRVLQVLLALTGLFFLAGIYPLLTSLPQHQQSDYGDQMMLAVYFVLGVFLLLAVRRPASHRSLIAFTGWGTLAHDAVMAVQASQQNQLRSEGLPLIVVALLCIALIVLVPPRDAASLSHNQQPGRFTSPGGATRIARSKTVGIARSACS
jgi:peptidoglycan/LPS O-acetylase OafA/YrhL